MLGAVRLNRAGRGATAQRSSSSCTSRGAPQVDAAPIHPPIRLPTRIPSRCSAVSGIRASWLSGQANLFSKPSRLSRALQRTARPEPAL